MNHCQSVIFLYFIISNTVLSLSPQTQRQMSELALIGEDCFDDLRRFWKVNHNF